MAYRIETYAGVAWQRVVDEDPDTGETVLCMEHNGDGDCWRMVMVGDDHVWHIDPDLIHELDDLEYCRSCGQIGCGMNVYV